MNFCKKCGKENSTVAKFCTSCGTVMGEVVLPPNDMEETKSRKKIGLFIGIASFIAIAFLVWVLFFQKKKHTPESAPTKEVVIDSVSSSSSYNKTQRKTVTLRYKDFSIGDLTHYTFTNINTGEEQELEFDETSSAGWESDWNELVNSCSEEGKNCPFTGQVYTASMEYKMADIYEWNGEAPQRTGKKEMRWLVISFKKAGQGSVTNSNNNNPGSYLGTNGKLVYKTECYIIVTGSFTNEADVVEDVKKTRGEGYPNAGYLWIPDYPSLSGKQFYAPFIGPFESYEVCKEKLGSMNRTGRFWYGLKVSMKNERVEIRI